MRAQRALEEVGVVFPPEHNLDRTIGGYRIFKRAKQQAKEHMLPRGPTSFRVYRKADPSRWNRSRRSFSFQCKLNTEYSYSGKNLPYSVVFFF